jgi:hypothetical protein
VAAHEFAYEQWLSGSAFNEIIALIARAQLDGMQLVKPKPCTDLEPAMDLITTLMVVKTLGMLMNLALETVVARHKLRVVTNGTGRTGTIVKQTNHVEPLRRGSLSDMSLEYRNRCQQILCTVLGNFGITDRTLAASLAVHKEDAACAAVLQQCTAELEATFTMGYPSCIIARGDPPLLPIGVYFPEFISGRLAGADLLSSAKT